MLQIQAKIIDGAVLCIMTLQHLAQPPHLYAGIAVADIEISRTAKPIDCDGKGFKQMRTPGKCFFDQKAELPVATARRAPGSAVDSVTSDLRHWLAARWQWFRPRTIPVTVAFAGMLGVLHAVSYLSTPPPHSVASGAMSGAIFVDGKPYQDGTRLPDFDSGYRVRLVIQQ